MNPQCPNCPAGSAHFIANGSYCRQGNSRRIRMFLIQHTHFYPFVCDVGGKDEPLVSVNLDIT